MSKSNVTKNFSILSMITIFEKLIAFVFEAMIAAIIGANYITDAYFTTSELFTLIDSAFLSALTVVSLNIFANTVQENDEKHAYEILSNIQSCYLPLMLVLGCLLFIFARPLSYLAAPGYDETTRQLVVRCIRFMSVIPPIVSVTSVWVGVLRQKKKFAITGLKSLFISVVGIAAVLLAGNREIKNADALSIAFVISAILYCGLVVWRASKYGKIHFVKPRMTDEVKRSMKILGPLMLSYGIARVALMVDKIIASTLGEGCVSALTYSHTLYKVVCAIFVTNLSTILLTDFNNLYASRNYVEMQKKIKESVSVMTLILLPITIISMIYSKEIVALVYERGEFRASVTETVGSVLLFYVINFIPAMIQGIYTQVLYSFGKTKDAMWVALAAMVLNLSLSIVLTMFVGLIGVAIGTVISTVIAVFIAKRVVRKYLPVYKGCYGPSYLIKCAGSGIAAAAAVIGAKMIPLPEIFSFLLAAAVGFGVFFVALIVMKESVMMSVISVVKKKFRHK